MKRIIDKLKRAKQEYEELRQYHNKCCEENANKLKEWLEKYNRFSRDFYSGKYCDAKHCKQLQAKEQERNELFNCLKQANGKRYAYKQALDEIERFIKNQLDGFGNDVYSMDKSAINSIQNIINNVKEK